MLLVLSPLERPRPVRRRLRSAGSIALLALFPIVQLGFPASVWAATEAFVPARGGLWAAMVVAFVLSVPWPFFWRLRLKAARRETARARELADHREYERNLAQQELVRRLEEERELAKEKMQFESQLAEYEKYASLAQLALGAAHEINNPLLGILSHLELEWKTPTRNGGRRSSSASRARSEFRRPCDGLLDYARPGPLKLSQVSLLRLVSRDPEVRRAPAAVPPASFAELRSAGPAQRERRRQPALANPDESAAQRGAGNTAGREHHGTAEKGGSLT